MKNIMLIVLTLMAFSAQAVEVKTECNSMNESREKIIKKTRQSNGKNQTTATRQ